MTEPRDLGSSAHWTWPSGVTGCDGLRRWRPSGPQGVNECVARSLRGFPKRADIHPRAAGRRRLAIGDWRLAIGDWRLAIRSSAAA